jgi:D-beta-D-heptose 7-phosphate kinase/D-beta-D-heptose 1-phosphate adenosyltransferase
VLERAEFVLTLRAIKERGKRVVFTNGCFDLIHVGHVRLLATARSFGDVLAVGLNTDRSVRQLKGPTRPIVSESARAEVLAALSMVDYVTLFDEPTPLELIRAVVPDVLVKGGDYAPDAVVGRKVVESAGGQVRIVRLVDGFSTSGIVEKLTGGRVEDR